MMKNKVLQYILDFGSITTYQAFTDLGCTRLSEYIRQLRTKHVIEDEWLQSTKGDANDYIRRSIERLERC